MGITRDNVNDLLCKIRKYEIGTIPGLFSEDQPEDSAEADGTVSKQTVMRALDGATIPNGKVEGKDKKKRPTKYKPRKPK